MRVGTDCSGIEAPICALRSLGVSFTHEFSSDIDASVRRNIEANYEPGVLFGDITTRDIADVPDIDLYVAGFPCQSFSKMNCARKGFDDEKRGPVFFSCVEVIRTKRPKYFVLENVRGVLTHSKGQTWEVIKTHLAQLKDLGYLVEWRVLNTRVHSGLPQNRPRLYIVGTLDHEHGIVWPEPVPMDPFQDYIDWNNTKKEEMPAVIKDVYQRFEHSGLWVVNEGGYLKYKTKEGFARFQTGRGGCWSPCMCASSRYWIVPLHRMMTGDECLRLQGFDPAKLSGLTEVEKRRRAGNSMTVPLVAAILRGLGI